jgi:2-iminobutanoate/2-iminopropanoate deaminase
MPHRHVATTTAPPAAGPYSQAIDTGTLVFCAGQVGIDPATGKLVDGFVAQADRVLRNLGAVLDAAGLDLSAVVKTTVFLVDVNDFPKLNEVYAGFFPDPRPARSTIGVAALPGGALVEIEAVAVRSS